MPRRCASISSRTCIFVASASMGYSFPVVLRTQARVDTLLLVRIRGKAFAWHGYCSFLVSLVLVRCNATKIAFNIELKIRTTLHCFTILDLLKDAFYAVS